MNEKIISILIVVIVTLSLFAYLAKQAATDQRKRIERVKDFHDNEF